MDSTGEAVIARARPATRGTRHAARGARRTAHGALCSARGTEYLALVLYRHGAMDLKNVLLCSTHHQLLATHRSPLATQPGAADLLQQYNGLDLQQIANALPMPSSQAARAQLLVQGQAASQVMMQLQVTALQKEMEARLKAQYGSGPDALYMGAGGADSTSWNGVPAGYGTGQVSRIGNPSGRSGGRGRSGRGGGGRGGGRGSGRGSGRGRPGVPRQGGPGRGSGDGSGADGVSSGVSSGGSGGGSGGSGTSGGDGVGAGPHGSSYQSTPADGHSSSSDDFEDPDYMAGKKSQHKLSSGSLKRKAGESVDGMPTECASNEGGKAASFPTPRGAGTRVPTPPGYEDDPTVNGGFRRRKLGQKGWASSTHFCKCGCVLKNCKATPKCKSVREFNRAAKGTTNKAKLAKLAKLANGQPSRPAWPRTSQSTVVHTTGRGETGNAAEPLPETVPVPVLELDVTGAVLNE